MAVGSHRSQMQLSRLAGAGIRRASSTNTFVITSTGTDTFDGAVLDNYSTVIWYTGANNTTTGNGTLSMAQEQFLEAWLDEGNKRLLMFAPYLVQDVEPFLHSGSDPPSGDPSPRPNTSAEVAATRTHSSSSPAKVSSPAGSMEPPLP